MPDPTRTYVLILTPGDFAFILRAFNAGVSRLAPRWVRGVDLREVRRALQYASPKTADDMCELGNDVLRREYFGACRSIAADIMEAVRSGEYGFDVDDAKDKARERVTEDVDGSEWVIYTANNFQVLRYSDNEGAYGENFGSEGIVDDGCIAWNKLAFAAMEADVHDFLGSDLESWGEYLEDLREAFSDEDIDVDDVEVTRLESDKVTRFGFADPADTTGCTRAFLDVHDGDAGVFVLSIASGGEMDEGKSVEFLGVPSAVLDVFRKVYVARKPGGVA